MNHKILLSDLAKAAGCSVSQASRAMNGKPNVAPEVRERVKQAAHALNYRNSANCHIPSIAILKSGVFSYYTAEMLFALEHELRKNGWRWQIIDLSNVALINEFFYDGVLSVIYSETIVKEAPALMNMPLVVINNYGMAMENICSVDPDSYEESHLVLEHLKALGHRMIARIKLVDFQAGKRNLERGDREFMRAAENLNLSQAENFNYFEDSGLEDVLKTIIARGFSAVFMIHQHLAVSISSCLYRLGVKIPEDISLVTYEVPKVTEFLHPPQTTLDFDFPELAHIAVEQLKRRMKGDAVPVSVKAPVKLNIRQSTAALY